MSIFHYILIGIAAILAVLFAVILARTLVFRPRAQVGADDEEITFDRNGAVEALRTLVRFPTVSYQESEKEDDAAFRALTDSLPSLYPNVFSVCEYTEVSDRAILIRWRGKSDGAPSVMMAHYDVVPVDASAWEKPPFEAILENDVLWGRGTLDTKVTVNGILFAANTLIGEGFVPENDIYFAFSGGEEVNGDGASRIVSWLEEKGITPALVVDEGGAVVENVFPGVKGPCAMIGIAEKGMMNVAYTTKSNGGHASAPKPHTPVGVVARACTRVESKPFPMHISRPVKEMFDTLGRHSTLLYRIIFANLWCFKGVLNMLCKKTGGELNAILRTTVAFTQMEGSSAVNVIPPEAKMVSNIRLNPLDTVESALERLKKTVNDENVSVDVLYGTNPSRVSETKCDAYHKVACAVASTWRGSLVTPYLMVQCSDSRHYGRISDRVYRFSAMDLTSEERATIHGHNERIRIETLHRAVEFYIRLMKNC